MQAKIMNLSILQPKWKFVKSSVRLQRKKSLKLLLLGNDVSINKPNRQLLSFQNVIHLKLREFIKIEERKLLNSNPFERSLEIYLGNVVVGFIENLSKCRLKNLFEHMKWDIFLNKQDEKFIWVYIKTNLFAYTEWRIIWAEGEKFNLNIQY